MTRIVVSPQSSYRLPEFVRALPLPLYPVPLDTKLGLAAQFHSGTRERGTRQTSRRLFPKGKNLRERLWMTRISLRQVDR